jgi:hypothetical protein
MAKHYYIPSYEEIFANIQIKGIIKYQDNKNIIELTDDRAKQNLIAAVEARDFAQEKELREYLDKHLPQLAKRIPSKKLDIETLKKAFEEIFNTELPKEVFESPDLIITIKNIINFVLKKNISSFLIIHITNEDLLIDLKYRRYKQIDFYFNMLKTRHDAEYLYSIMTKVNIVLLKVYLEEIYYETKSKPLSIIKEVNEAFNVVGKTISMFKSSTDLMLEEIKDNDLHLKRTMTPKLPKYNTVRDEVVKELTEISKDLDKKNKTIMKYKTNLTNEIKERKALPLKLLEKIGKTILTFS